jgi:hypothetical protein
VKEMMGRDENMKVWKTSVESYLKDIPFYYLAYYRNFFSSQKLGEYFNIDPKKIEYESISKPVRSIIKQKKKHGMNVKNDHERHFLASIRAHDQLDSY